MDIRDFLSCMRLLNAYYIDWQFNFEDKLQVDTWYQFLQSSMDFERLKKIVKIYIARNDHGPNSPRDLFSIDAELKLKEMIHNDET